MKTLRCSGVLMCLFLSLSPLLQAQQLKLGATPSVLEKSALLELNSDRQGVLLPRVNDYTIALLNTAPDGMFIYYVPDKTVYIRKNNIWRKLSNETNTITSVNGQTGPIVNLTTNDIAESGNLYYTDARTRAAFSAGTGIVISGTGVISVLNSSPTFTAGSVPFAGATGILTENNTNFFWDFTNNRLGIGINTPNNIQVGDITTGDISNLAYDPYTLNITSGLLKANNTNAQWNANQLEGFPVATTTPTTGQSLVFDGISWSPATTSGGGPSGPAWVTTGNAGTSATTNFIGTTDHTAFVVKTNNIESARFDDNQRVGIATPSPNSTLSVNGSVAVGMKSYYNASIPTNINLNEGFHTVAVKCDDYHYPSNLTANLPAAAGCLGRTYVFCLTIAGSGSGKIYVKPNGSESIGSLGNGATMQIDERTTVTPQSAGTHWMVLYRGSSQGN